MAMAAAQKQEPAKDPLAISDEDVAAVIAEAGGDALEAVRMLLRDLAVMALDADAASSSGFLRGRFSAGHRRPDAVDAV
jgi:hypothetical protein